MRLTQKKPEKREFIELKSTCNNMQTLRGYKLIGFSCNSESGSIDLVVTLWNARTNENGFFTIGGKDIATADFKIPHDMVKFRSGFGSKNSLITNFISNNNFRAIGLLYDKNNPFKDFALTQTKTFIKINSNIIEQLKKNLVDLVIYTRDRQCNKCNLFEIIHEEFTSKQYTLREHPMSSDKNDISLNRCAVESIGFLPEKFKLGNPTPGSENDCGGPHFILKDHILDTIAPVNEQSAYLDDFDDIDGAGCSNQCTSTIEPTDLSLMSKDLLNQAFNDANVAARNDVCTSSLTFPDGGNTGMEVVHENQRKRHISDEQDYAAELEWTKTSFFKPEWINQIKSHQSDLIPTEEVEKNKIWFEYLFNSAEPKKSTFRCRICYKYYDNLKLEQRYKSGLAYETGTLRAQKSKNKIAIAEHAKNTGHLTIIQILEQKNAKRLFFKDKIVLHNFSIENDC